MQDDTEAEDIRINDHTNATSKIICNGCSTKSPKEGTSGQEGHDHGGLGRGHIGKVVRGVDVSGGEELSPVFYGEDSVDGAGFITGGIILVSYLCKEGPGQLPKQHTTKCNV